MADYIHTVLQQHPSITLGTAVADLPREIMGLRAINAFKGVGTLADMAATDDTQLLMCPNAGRRDLTAMRLLIDAVETRERARAAKNQGRPPEHGPGQTKRAPLNMRTSPDLRAKIEAAAENNGLSLSQEVERRLLASFDYEDAASYLQKAFKLGEQANAPWAPIDSTPAASDYSFLDNDAWDRVLALLARDFLRDRTALMMVAPSNPERGEEIRVSIECEADHMNWTGLALCEASLSEAIIRDNRRDRDEIERARQSLVYTSLKLSYYLKDYFGPPS